MQHFSALDLETAFVRPDTPTFADLIEMLNQETSLSLTRRRDLRSGLNRVAKVLNINPHKVPADPRWLQPRLKEVLPKFHGLSTKSWSNAVSDARAAMAKFGVIKSKNNKLDDLNSELLPLWQSILSTKDRGLTAPLSQLFYFLNNAGISPTEVTNDHLLAYRDALSLNQIRRDPEAAYTNAFYAWNRLGSKIAGWPGTVLTREPRAKRVKLPLDIYPTSFCEDLDALCAKLAAPDPFDDDPSCRPLRPASISQYRRVLERFAGVLVRDGLSPSEIVGVETLVKLENAERGLRWMLADYNNELRPALSDTARVLKSVAKRYSSLSDAEIEKLGSFVGRLSTKQPIGMTAKNRERLRALRSDDVRKALFCLPDHLFERAGTCDQKASGLLREQAIAIAILTIIPLRRKNLVSIHLDRHLHRPRDGSVFLVFEPHEVKNKQRIECQLPPYLVDMIDQHVKLRAPNFCATNSPWLFPKRDGTVPMCVDHLACLVVKRLKSELGVTMNMHLFRHFAANMMLEAHPGNYEATRRLLGHSRLSSTLNAYTGFENITASRLFGEIISGARKK